MKRITILSLALMLLIALSPLNSFAQRYGGTFVFIAPYGGDIGSLNAHARHRAQDRLIHMNINRSLYRWDAVQGIPVLALAKKVDRSDDGLLYTYHIHEGVKFHNGR